MSLEKKPFVNYKLDEDKREGEDIVFSVRANAKRQRLLAEAKEWLDTDKNSTAMWFLVERGHNVLLRTFGRETLEWLFKKDRARRL